MRMVGALLALVALPSKAPRRSVKDQGPFESRPLGFFFLVIARRCPFRPGRLRRWSLLKFPRYSRPG